ncbi:hypothetical protein ACFL31_00050 [Candidatus Margulisiibacteriota bacterium]
MADFAASVNNLGSKMDKAEAKLADVMVELGNELDSLSGATVDLSDAQSGIANSKILGYKHNMNEIGKDCETGGQVFAQAENIKKSTQRQIGQA